MRNLEKEIIDLSKRLIRYKTTKDRISEQYRCLGFIKKYFRGKDFFIREFTSDKIKTLIIGNTLSRHPDLMFYSHIDVVDASDKNFIPKIKKGRLYGRGASDMKAVSASEMVLFKNLVLSKYPKKLSLLIVSDEEIGGFNGARIIVENKNYRPKVVLVPDGGDNWKMVIGEKGIYWLKIYAYGKSAHGSTPWLGDNAGEKLLSGYLKIKRNFHLAKDEKEKLPSINLGKLDGGRAFNQVMDSASIGLDIRYPHQFTVIEIKEKIKKILGKDFVIKDVETIKPSNVNIDSHFYLMENILKKKLKVKKIEKIFSCGGSDARFFSYRKIPAIVFEPVCGDHHGDNEWIDLKSLFKFYSVCLDFANELVKIH